VRCRGFVVFEGGQEKGKLKLGRRWNVLHLKDTSGPGDHSCAKYRHRSHPVADTAVAFAHSYTRNVFSSTRKAAN
jgi:hypothetical protein